MSNRDAMCAAPRSIPPIQKRCSLAASSRPFGAELLNRLDVSKYYVIRTIIILNMSVEGILSPKVPEG
jgi:hypothetical protein